MDSCIYCGEASHCFDHVIPRAYLSPAKRTGTEPGFKVPSCNQCNSILGDRIFGSLVERKQFAHERLKVKLAKWNQSVLWDEEELSSVGHNLRSTIEISQAKTRIARDRIKYSAAPPDIRWLEMEERWRQSHSNDSIPESKLRSVG